MLPERILIPSNCIITHGKFFSTISDLQFSEIYLLDKEFAVFLENSNGKLLDEVQSEISQINKVTYTKYLHQLIEEKIIYLLTADLENFVSLNMDFDYYAVISNILVEMHNLNNHSYNSSLFDFLDDVTCTNIEIVIYDELRDLDILNLRSFLKKLLSLRISVRHLSFHISCSSCNLNHLVSLFDEFKSLRFIVLYSTDEFVEQIDSNRYISGSPVKLASFRNCGNISQNYFSINIRNFTESKSHNSCLNRKLAIDLNGQIKNCPAMPESFGSIKGERFKDVVNKISFQKYWDVTKDDINICKDCPFRYVCTDCRAYTERTTFKEELDLSKPLKCGYNPYTNEWAEWSTNPLKEKAIAYYGMEDLVKKNVK
jgi:SPASM domain peptide maturase of grasp-with-spasm system